jgi:hypothetical protein
MYVATDDEDLSHSTVELYSQAYQWQAGWRFAPPKVLIGIWVA